MPFNYATPPAGEATSLQLRRCKLIWGWGLLQTTLDPRFILSCGRKSGRSPPSTHDDTGRLRPARAFFGGPVGGIPTQVD